jgi:hypothetical protein
MGDAPELLDSDGRLIAKVSQIQAVSYPRD